MNQYRWGPPYTMALVYYYWGTQYQEYTGGKEIFNCPNVTRDTIDYGYYVFDFNDIKYAAYGLNWFMENQSISKFEYPSKTIFTHDAFEQRMDYRPWWRPINLDMLSDFGVYCNGV